MTTYRMTRQHLDQALTQAIEMFIELFDDRDPESCKYAAVSEIMQGIDADRELVANDPTEQLRLQLPDNESALRAALRKIADGPDGAGVVMRDIARAALATAQEEARDAHL